MAPTRTIKNKHATNKSGIKNSKSSKSGGGRSSGAEGVVKTKRDKGKIPASQLNSGRSKMLELLQRRRKTRTYSEKELDIPKLNTITPVGVQKPKGKKKGKVFVDDKESMTTILAMVQAEKDGQIESKIMKSRQMEEIRQARLAEAEKKESDRQAKLDEKKQSLRKKRKRPGKEGSGGDDESVGHLASAGTKAGKPKKKRVSFAGAASE
ncbi:60S ribosomal subunit assembly/export protein LOC1 [Sporothrix brasiliensis 5110]|uniref:60S ribosomal subunit assembly/export protein LOC1 n=1 Tax=Sporothrix brasiliensis 5110 TaxID=1398154 RepID=A0A0C2IVK8_9PEZI|nr:60S ribosomal subunit assembly/export protein LOC1 [Sporothrix brasiliensis 5110]KIH90830.1 60S ribosomal subunit assembly/export protein LOC1 [Sporothrix brasiliensis 5110]